MTETGLTTPQAQAALQQFGRNHFATGPRYSAVRQLISQFTTPIVIVLMVAAGLSAMFGDFLSCSIILTMMLLSIVLDFLNTHKSHAAAEALKSRVRVLTPILRDGQWQSLPLEVVVPGDLIRLEAGQIVPADGKIVDSTLLFANEASLTGESFPQSKAVGAPVYLGSAILSGAGLMRVTATGAQARYAQIAKALTAQVRPTAYEQQLSNFSALIVKVTILLVLFVLAMSIWLHRPFLEAVLFSLALAVGLTPEMLPLIVTLNLTKGTLKMAKHGVIVKQLSAVQNFGNMDILCTDKTGTLTQDSIVLIEHVDAAGQKSERVLKLGYISSLLSTGFKSPLDSAIENFQTFGLENYQKISEVPFDFERRREVVVVNDAHQAGHLVIVKGAPETILALCHWPTTGSQRHAADQTYQALSRRGFRVLAVATRRLKLAKTATAEGAAAHPDLDHDLIFEGFLAFLDPAKESVKPVLKLLNKLGITVKIITGDNAIVTEKIAGDIGLTVSGIITGTELAKLETTAFAAAAEANTIFARISPNQKMQLIQALQKNGHVVGYLGDGVNDAPSLRAADVGVSVANAVDVARDAADLIMLQKSLHELTQAVIEGRQTFSNTRKYLRMALSSNFGNMVSMAAASIFLPFLPLTATQVLLNNILYDSSQFGIPFDHVDEAELYRPQQLDMKKLLRFMIKFGLLSSLFDFATFGLLLHVFHASAKTFQTSWFIESILTQMLVVFIIRSRGLPFFQSRPSWQLVGGVGLMITIALLCVLTPIGQLFTFTALSPLLWASVLGLTAAYLLLAEVIKKHDSA